MICGIRLDGPSTRVIFKNRFQLNYYLLMQEGEEISDVPAGSWSNFDKVQQYNKQLALEEAEEKMIDKKKTQDLYQTRLMKAATDEAVAFGKVNKFGGDVEGNISDNGDEEEDVARKNRLGLERRGGDDDFDNDDGEKDDDWKLEEIFSDDDENNTEETEYDDDADTFSCVPPKKLKTENNQDQKPSIKEEPASASPISEEEIRAVFEKEQAISWQARPC